MNESDAEKLEELVVRLGNINEGVDILNELLTGSLKMARIGREALERVGCIMTVCEPDDPCTVCRALADITAVAMEFSR